MKTILIALILMFVAGLAYADPVDIIAAQDTTLSLTAGWYELGPRAVDLAIDGDASITFYWLDKENKDRTTVLKSKIYYLRAAFPPRGLSFTTGPDSAGIDHVTATETVLTVHK